MKYLFLFLLVNLANPSWAVTSDEIKANVLELAVIAEGPMMEYQLSGNTVEELVQSFAEQEGAVVQDTDFIFNDHDVAETDEPAYGTTSAKKFSALLFSAIHVMDDDANENQILYSADERAKIKEILQKLKSANIVYSWNPNGASVCGTFYTTPVLIDVQSKKAYEINFYKFEGC